jgi:hypothetical protein
LFLRFQHLASGVWLAVLKFQNSRRQAKKMAIAGGPKREKMPRLALLDPASTGTLAEDLEKKLRQ